MLSMLSTLWMVGTLGMFSILPNDNYRFCQ